MVQVFHRSSDMATSENKYFSRFKALAALGGTADDELAVALDEC